VPPVLRKSVAVAGGLLGLGLVVAFAVWVAWTWPWAPLVWVGAALALAGLNATHVLSRR
jgi:hypothetical protein